MNRHCIPGLYVHSPDGELLCRVSGIIKTMRTGFSAYTYLRTICLSADIGKNQL